MGRRLALTVMGCFFDQPDQGGIGMAGQELNMKDIQEIRRLKALGFGKRRIARTLGVHRDTVTKYFEESEVEGGATNTLPVNVLAAPVSEVDEKWAGKIDWPSIRDEILKGVPINIVFSELVEQNKVPVQYPAFWKQLQRRAPMLKTTMVRVFPPGSRTEIDYCDGIDIVNVATGELLKTELFVGVLCSSRYTFAEFTLSQKSADFLSSHVRMFDFFGGVSQVVAPDNLKSAVTKAHRYDPVLNPAYTKLATHYQFAVVPARVKRPQDKALVERTIQIFQRWFFMLVRNRTFTSLLELNACLREHLALFNQKRHRIFRKTRTEMFEAEREHLMPLPKHRYQVSTHSVAQLSRDCHLIFDRNFYSSPHKLRGLELDVWATESAVEIYHKAERVAFHARSKTEGKFVTKTSHYPPEHQAYLEEDIVKSKSWAIHIGPETAKLIEALLSGPFPLRHLRRAQNILRLSKKYSKARLEQAAKTANRFNQTTTQYIERVIKQNSKPFEVKQGGDPIERAYNPHLRGVDRIIH
jgi:transposase